jgi:hypothetical protein
VKPAADARCGARILVMNLIRASTNLIFFDFFSHVAVFGADFLWFFRFSAVIGIGFPNFFMSDFLDAI